MHLSNKLQKHLKHVGSSIELAKTIFDELPSQYAFYHKRKERDFRVHFGRNKSEFSLLLFDRTKERNHEICYLRGIFSSLEKVAEAIQNWIEDEMEVDKLANKFLNFEKYQFDNYENPNPKIEQKWKYVRNRIFNDASFWQNEEWQERYFEMVYKIKRREEWKNYFPFTSHHLLRFSLDEELSYCWELGFHIVPTQITEIGTYQVGVPSDGEKHIFKKLDDAIEFYSKKLNEHPPTNWGMDDK